MKARHLLSHPIAKLAGLCAGIFLSGAAYAVTRATFNYSTPQTGYLTIHAMDLAPSSDLSEWDGYTNLWNGGGLRAGLTGCFNAGINLPQGAVITSVIVWADFFDDFLSVELVRSHLATNARTNVASLPPSSEGGRKAHYAKVDADSAQINNAAFAYGFGVCMTDNEVFYQTRITYTYTKAGD